MKLWDLAQLSMAPGGQGLTQQVDTRSSLGWRDGYFFPAPLVLRMWPMVASHADLSWAAQSAQLSHVLWVGVEMEARLSHNQEPVTRPQRCDNGFNKG